MYIPAWKTFLGGLMPFIIAGLITTGVSLFIWFLPNVIQRYNSVERNVVTVTETVYETVQVSDSVRVQQEFAVACTLLGGFVSPIAGVTFCIDAEPVPGIVWGVKDSVRFKATHDCMLAGGKIIDLSPSSHDRGCYKYTIYEELGARHDYILRN